MRILLLGGTGQVGQEFRTASAGNIDVAAPDRADWTYRASAMTKAIAAEPWDAVVNAAAYTEVDRAETKQRSRSQLTLRPPLAAEKRRATLYPSFNFDRLRIRRSQRRRPMLSKTRPVP